MIEQATDALYVANPRRTLRYVSHKIQFAKNRPDVDFLIWHEYDDHGNHRMRSLYGPGPWASYSEPAVLVIKELGKIFAAYTEYIGEGINEVRQLEVAR